jgi:asparagine synthetase B (glutamine-hydrolysing)
MELQPVTTNNSNLFTPDTEWILAPAALLLKNEGFIPVFKNDYYILYFKLSGYTEIKLVREDNNVNFIIGNAIPRLHNEPDSLINVKGHFALIRFSGNQTILANDHFGVQKFFYTENNGIIASNHLENIIALTNQLTYNNVSRMLYLLFNYFVWGRTIFKEIRCSEPSTIIYANGLKITKEAYLKINRTKYINYSHIEKTESVSKQLVEILGQYKSQSGDNVCLTLTGGYDSRMILAGLLGQKSKISVFTFGNPESQDAINARTIAKSFNLPYRTFPIGSDLINDFHNITKNAVLSSSGMLNILRMIRMEYFRQAVGPQEDLYLGYAGSEIIRGLYPDGLLSSRFFEEYSVNRYNNESLVKAHLSKFRFEYSESDIGELLLILSEKENSMDPFQHLIQTIIPLHFGEDIRWLEMAGVKCRVPFMDIDFVEFLAKMDCISLLRPDEKRIKKNHFSRIDNPQLSASTILKLNKKLGSLLLGKGFSPRDYLFSKYFAGGRLVLKKIFYKKEPVTIFYPWYPSFLEKILSDSEINLIGFDKQKLLFDFSLEKNKGEIDYLPFTKFYNLFLIKKVFEKR